MLAVQLNLCVGAGAPSAPSSEGGEAATAAYHSITSVPQRHKKCAATGGTHSFFMRPKGALHTASLCFMRRRRASFAAQPQKKAPREGAVFVLRLYPATLSPGYIAPSARLCPPFGRVIFLSLRDKSLGVCAVRTHFDRVVRVNKCWRCS